jgi:hypothetical protein
MSFLLLPPETTSALLHAGAGSGPMLAAAAAWDGLAAELGSAAQSFSSLTSELAADAWRGAASAAMLSTAAQYTGVLGAAAAQAQTTAAQAQTVASEFEAAVAAAVHPALVTANRSQLVQLVFSNLFGQNAPAIAATESDYEAMWARDVAAMVGYHGGVSAAAAQLSSWAEALPRLSGGLAAAIAGNPAGALSSLSPAAGGPLGGLLGSDALGPLGGAFVSARHLAVDVVNAPTSLLFGFNLIPSGPQPTGGSATISGSTATTPLTLREGTEPIVDASVGSGGAEPLLVDTGSRGLVIPFTDVGGLVGLLRLGIPLGINMSSYGFGTGAVDFVYLTYDAKVNFGGGLVAAHTPVDVEIFAFPTSLQSLQQNGLTFQSSFATDGAAGVLGVGPNATGPLTSTPIQALPPPFNQGLLINENQGSGGYLQFGANPLAPTAQLNGFPITTLYVGVNGGTPQAVPSIVDSGGVNGSIPSFLNVKPGDTVDVYAPGDPNALYEFTDQVNYSPVPISSGLMNTGNLLFFQYPVYISYSPDGVGTAFIDS